MAQQQKAISDKSNLTVSLSYLVQIIGAICAVVYTYVSLTAEITSLENQVVLMKEDLKEVTKILNKNSVHHEELGIITQNDMIINEKTKVTIDELKSYYTNWLSKFMS